MGKDHPPDLGALVPSDGIVLPDTQEKTSSSLTSEKKHVEKNPIVANTKSRGVAGIILMIFSIFKISFRYYTILCTLGLISYCCHYTKKIA